ncbi:unnamed protein product [Caenorhabditis brenneri]
MILGLGVGDLYNLRINNDTGIYEKQTALCLSHHIFAGLEYLHKKSIVHRDMKEANIVLKRDCRNQKHPIMIVDLGLAISNKVPRNPDHRDSFFKEWFNSPWMTLKRIDFESNPEKYVPVEKRGSWSSQSASSQSINPEPPTTNVSKKS